MRYKIAPVFDGCFHIPICCVGMSCRSNGAVLRYKAAKRAFRIVFGRIRPTRYAFRKICKQRFIFLSLRRRNKRRTLRSALICGKIRSFQMRSENIPFCFSGMHYLADIPHSGAHTLKSSRRYRRQNRRRTVAQMKITTCRNVFLAAVRKGISASAVRMQIDKPRRDVQPGIIVYFIAWYFF